MELLTKREIRKILQERRDVLSPDIRQAAAFALLDHFNAVFAPMPEDVISGYWPIKSEMDVKPLLQGLHAQGYRLCLPLVQESLSLIFKAWQPGDKLIDKNFNLSEPLPERQKLIPTYLLIPLLGYDSRGRRIGYGQGHYDKTLVELRKNAKIAAIGVAFSCQEYPELPQEAHDQKLDFILTEKGLTAF